MERALVEVPHVRIVLFCQHNELGDLIDDCPINIESLLEGVSTHLPFPVRLSLRQSVLYEPMVDPSVVDSYVLWSHFSVQDTRYSSYNNCAWTLNASFGKRHMILVSTECRTTEYHMKSASRPSETNRFLPPPLIRRRFQF